MIKELPIEKLKKTCDPQVLGCNTSEEVNALEAIIGQDRAVRALRFGLGIREKGFNIYVAGRPGTGKTTAVGKFLEEIAKKEPCPSDWCYVHNFLDPYRPEALRFPPGWAVGFRTDMESLIGSSMQEIRNAFEGEEYASQRENTSKTFQQQKQDILERLNEQAYQAGFVLQATPMGLLTIPLKKGKPMSDEEFISLEQKEKDQIIEKQRKLQESLEVALRQVKGLDKESYAALEKLDMEVTRFAIGHLFNELKVKYHELTEVITYLDQVRDDILTHVSDFKADREEQPQMAIPGITADRSQLRDRQVKKYAVNMLVDHARDEGAPVILEQNPTYSNLFGRIEQEARFGALTTDFTLIRGGSIHRANGGYLVLPVEELLRNPLSWDSLKRALENAEITIEDASEKLGFAITKNLRPEAIPLKIKVILIGRPDIYQLLLAYDQNYNELFKVKADFDAQMDRTPENMQNYVAFVSALCKNEKLNHLDCSALTRLVEHGSRLVEDQEKLSTHFGEIADVIREASYYAGLDGSRYVTAAHIKKTIDERFYRSSLVRERIQEMIMRGVIKIDVDGSHVGQVNGLSVLNLGDFMFGQPSRITVSVGLGREGLIDIEREAEMGGPIHTKGVLILSGFLAEKYTQDKPLSLSARLVFEQSYSGVEGDSASSTELYAILSALSGIPIRQGIAVTGSVNQKGEVQAIGGVNEKIEGFFEICRAKGLTGEQGVIIPDSNAANLMLKEEVLETVGNGRFHVWPVKTIDEGIEVLTGVKAGARQEDGSFEEGSVNARVDQKLKDMAEKMVEFEKKEDYPTQSRV
jgi:lon-related putative ATP-dependent protease